MLKVTVDKPEGYEIEEYIGYVTETTTFGINDFIEFFLIADAGGGDSTIYKNTINKAKKVLNERLEIEARNLGADAIVGLRINYSEVSAKGRSMILVSGTGTAVKLRMTEETKERIIEREKQEELDKKKKEEKEKELEIERLKKIEEEDKNLFVLDFEKLKQKFFWANDEKRIEIAEALNTKEEVILKREAYSKLSTKDLEHERKYGDIFAELELLKRKK